jgi:DnaJ-class molecular chaperone
MKNSYEILNISPASTNAQVRRAYRKLAMKWHQDKNPDDPEAESRFKEIQQAYESLIDDKATLSQNTHNEGSEAFYTAMQDHPFQSLREAVIKYYSDRGWFKNNPGQSKK